MAEMDDSGYERLLLRSDSVTWPRGWQKKSGPAGSYGAVYTVKVHGFTCIAKRLHDVLREGEGGKAGTARMEGETTVADRFVDECKTLSRLHHPNIVQFIGVHRNRTSADPNDISLIMEGLYMDLDGFLEKQKGKETLSLSLKLSFLLDVSNALVYLHKHAPPIIHRDVKAANVLLTRDMRAKLADLGTSKLLDFNPLASTKFTQCPGTVGIMPPEALQSNPVYDTQLDVFSFGTLIIHVINQEFPLPVEVTETKKKGEMQIAKRQAAVDMLGKGPIQDLTKHCLQDFPGKRPVMTGVRDTLEKLSLQHPCNFTTFYDMHKELEACKKWQSKMNTLATEITELRAEITQARDGQRMAEDQAAVFKEDFETERRDRERAAGKYDSNLRRLQAENETLLKELQLYKENNTRLQHEIQQMREERERPQMRNTTKTLGSRLAKMSHRKRKEVRATTRLSGLSPPDDLLQSLQFRPADHSSGGQRCSQRYEWYQTASEVIVDIMVPNVTDDDILVEFSSRKVKVFIAGESPYRLSLHTCHDIVVDKCFVKCLTTKVELKLKKADGVHWSTLDERGEAPKTCDEYFHKWDAICEDEEDD